jgi:hypothetical protein
MNELVMKSQGVRPKATVHKKFKKRRAKIECSTKNAHNEQQKVTF